MITPVIIAGGCGTRLWPLSRAMYPKQFLPLGKTGRTMLQDTARRVKRLTGNNPLTVCNQEHRFLVAEQLREENQLGPIVLEPFGRSTAPAIAIAAMIAQKTEGEEALLLVLPADHCIEEPAKFCDTVTRATQIAEEGKLVTFGIVPTHAHTGYGYIKTGAACDEGFLVDEFREKPEADTAASYLADGRYLWNSGMFLFRADRYLDELKKHQPTLLNICEKTLANANQDFEFTRLNAEIFERCPDISIDYAVMEKTDEAVVFPLESSWCDLGSWSAIWEHNDHDSNGNVVRGEAITEDTHNCLMFGGERLITTVGLEDLIIVDTKDALLVAKKDRAEEVKAIINQLKDQDAPQLLNHREVLRPWGKYDSIDNGDRYQAKRITVKPGEKLSVQMHHHRAEHWIVVSGTARVTRGEEQFLVSENESTYIPIGVVHALENPGKIPLEMIEVQSGTYLGEDDIVRFEDRYGRG